MKKYLSYTLIFLYILWTVDLFAACGGSSPNLTAASASQSDVVDCVTAATYGDTIVVPAGEATWTAASQGCTGNSMLCMKKGIKLQGNGAGSTIITLSGAAPYGAICYEPDATSVTNNQAFEFTGFTVDAGGVDYGEGMLDIRNSSTTAITNNKIHANTFQNGGASGHAILINGPVYGVSYLNTFIDIGTVVKVEGGNSKSWNLNHRVYGSVNSWFHEDNTNTSTSRPSGGFTAGQGGSLVYRYNTINTENGASAALADLHGLQSMSSSSATCNGGCDGTEDSCYTQTTGGTRCASEWSQVKSEIYGNQWTNLNKADGYSYSVIQRGSWMLSFANSLAGTYAGGSVPRAKYRQYACDESQNPASPAYSQHIQNTYLWNNLYNGTDYGLVTIGAAAQYGGDYCSTGVGTYTITENVDYYNKAASFDGTAGVGCGTLAARPATCTAGVGYWATDQSCSDLTGLVGVDPATPISGTLYKCTATDTWEAYYTPYSYPHPLRGETTTHTVTSSKVGAAGTLSYEGESVLNDGDNSQIYTATVPNGWKVTWSGTGGCTGSGTTCQVLNVTGDATVIATFTEIKLMPW